MSKRITNKDLQAKVDLINIIVNKTPANLRPGHYYIGYANGGTRLEQTCEGGGARDISDRGTKRETYDFMRAFLKGIEAAPSKGGAA